MAFKYWKSSQQFPKLSQRRFGPIDPFEAPSGNKPTYINIQGPWYYFWHDVIKWKHFPRYWPFERGIHRSPVNSPHKGQWRGALIFSLICAWLNGWVNNREAGDLRRHRAYYDVIVMSPENRPSGRRHIPRTQCRPPVALLRPPGTHMVKASAHLDIWKMLIYILCVHQNNSAHSGSNKI